MTAYAQYGEDLAIERFFEGMKNGWYMDVGAHDGLTFSNTAMLHFEHGWSGICIEPNPQSFLRLVSNRPGAVCLPFACVGDDTDLLYATLFVPPLSVLSTLSMRREDEIKRMHRDQGASYETPDEIHVPVSTVGKILKRVGPPRLDLLSIDTDWCNYDTLVGSDIATWRPRLVVIEANWDEEKVPISEHMARLGYTLGGISMNNMFWVRDSGDAVRVTGIHE